MRVNVLFDFVNHLASLVNKSNNSSKVMGSHRRQAGNPAGGRGHGRSGSGGTGRTAVNAIRKANTGGTRGGRGGRRGRGQKGGAASSSSTAKYSDYCRFEYGHYGNLRNGPSDPKYREATNVVALDCEMVGIGPGKINGIGRVSIVNEFGFCLFDSFVTPNAPVTDYRTRWSGIRKKDLINAPPVATVGTEVSKLLEGRILVGHSLTGDLQVLALSHPSELTRDTAEFFKDPGRRNPPSLKTLTERIFGVRIQTGEHSSIEDAQATMAVYQSRREEWEHNLATLGMEN